MRLLVVPAGSKKLRIKDCRGLGSIRGLMFDPLTEKDGALISANNIWTPFCVPLDLYFLDSQFRVLERQRAPPLTLNPATWKVYKNLKASYCLELRAGKPMFKQGQRVLNIAK